MYGLGLFFIFIGFLVVGIPLLMLIGLLIKEQGWYAIPILSVLVGFVWLKIEYMEQDIKSKSIERFGIEPKYIDINFNVLRSGGGTPHATVCKDGKEYYWSFKENDFVDYYEHECYKKCYKSRGTKPTPESLEKLFDKYIFTKGNSQ